MKPGLNTYSNLLRKTSSQVHHFIKKLGYKKNERLYFVLVNDDKRRYKPAVTLQKPLKHMEKWAPQMTLFSKYNKPIHLLSQNARGYAVFMGINYRGKKGREIKEIRAQFIDVDLNKIKECLNTNEQVKQKIQSIKSNPSEQIQSITVYKNKQGQYQLLAHRTERRIAQLKKEFLKKHWNQIRNAMIIETNNGYHIYWVIKGGSISKFVPIQKALAQKFGSDPKITDLSRVMRIPGFYHMKNPKRPFLVRVIQWGRKNPFTQDELINKLALKSYIMRVHP
ncbi:DNA-primase RepB domain-containing protein [Ammoniphilus sp. 3BR4]|uniref:DNA-primase RepB domain-containing protein n=1 Tax=Ammoniphilus sp. 3BR4 TaxID=3158265 RepID=UPI00346705AD